MLKITRKIIAGMAVMVGLSPLCGQAGVRTAFPWLRAPPAWETMADRRLLKLMNCCRTARTAMSEGKYEVAQDKMAQAEALHSKYPMFHVGDTTKKARADLDRLVAEKAAATNRKSQKALAKAINDPFLAQRANPDNNSGKTTNSSTTGEATSGSPAGNATAAGSSNGISNSPTTTRLSASNDGQVPNVTVPTGGLRMPGRAGSGFCDKFRQQRFGRYRKSVCYF